MIVVINLFEVDKVPHQNGCEEERNVYKEKCVDEMLEDDQLSSEEEAFMRGYLL